MQAVLTRVRFVDVHHRREVQLFENDLVALGIFRRQQARQNQRLTNRNVLVHDHRVCVSSDNPGDLVTERHRLVPPPFGPRAHAARRPDVGVFVQTIVSRPRHRAQTVRDQVNRSVQNRKLRAVFEKVVSHRLR